MFSVKSCRRFPGDVAKPFFSIMALLLFAVKYFLFGDLVGVFNSCYFLGGYSMNTAFFFDFDL